ncbi:c2 domain-containing protein [Diplodia corticola]|uniref:C2 domain-containing protein n=1 Tax=Diplodia corticola TaxID=236234 RepID=A0A1J9RVI4_9PEZI|nr:c2 domain-containing protein [Diplodia corticola]OJD32399.1 c2 domain-containing protein [Diplodia corticola]
MTAPPSSQPDHGHDALDDDGAAGAPSGHENPVQDVAASHEEPPPPGGFSDTPVPHATPGFTLKFTFHRANHLPIADINTMSSDPYVLAQLNTALPPRHKEDPLLRMRSPTVHRSTEPVFECEWIVANVPASGFKLKVRLYDEDPADHDDRLGNLHINVPQLSEDWEGIHQQTYKLRKRLASKRAYALRAAAVAVNKAEHMGAEIVVSIELLGRTQDPYNEGGRAYTLGPLLWYRHNSPLLGRIVNRTDSGGDDESNHPIKYDRHGNRINRYNFQANEIQLRGPVPPELYHRYVEFKPFVRSMYTAKGVRGFLLSKALHHQHARVYNYDKSTSWGKFDEPCFEQTMKFLELVHFDQGGRIFTYVLTLDALWRFTETGKEFGIDMLSKHTMHSDVSVYIAFSGEFFIRRLKHPHHRADAEDEGEHQHHHHSHHRERSGDNSTHPPDDISGGPPVDEPPKDPKHYELVIDNDSGTYRPNAKLLPLLKSFMESRLPGLKVTTLDCQADADKMARMKQEQRDLKAREGDQIVYHQLSESDNDSSSLSSSDEDELEEAVQSHHARVRDDHVLHAFGHQARAQQQAKAQHLKSLAHRPGSGMTGHKGHPDPVEAPDVGAPQ